MSTTIAHHDFIELEYTGKLADGTVFDTTNKSLAQKNNLLTENRKFGPARICVGEQQILPGLDAQMEGKEVGKEYTVKLSPEQAFGKRDIKKLKIIPMGTFSEHNMQPQPGLQIDVDGEMGTVTRVSGGRVMVNFNHPLAGKEVVYEVKILRKITEPKEQIRAFLNTTFQIAPEKMSVEIAEGTEKAERTATVSLPVQLPVQFTDAIGKKLAELTGLKEVLFSTEIKKGA